jgi:hypothetical protein
LRRVPAKLPAGRVLLAEDHSSRSLHASCDDAHRKTGLTSRPVGYGLGQKLGLVSLVLLHSDSGFTHVTAGDSCLQVVWLVEPRRFELLTSAVQRRRSPN